MSFTSFIQGTTIHKLGMYSASQAVEHSSRGILGKSEFYRVLGKVSRNSAWLAGKSEIP